MLDMTKRSDTSLACYNIDSFLENIMKLYIKKDTVTTMDEKNQLILSLLSIKDRLNCQL